jgi:hypothetical protein
MKGVSSRFDFVFSYWIFVWFLFYAAGFTSFCPLIALVVALAENILLFFFLFYYKYSLTDIKLFIIITFFIKIVPLLWILKYGRFKNVIWKDIIFMIGLFSIYLGWLRINGVSLTDLFPRRHRLDTPLIHFIRKNML